MKYSLTAFLVAIGFGLVTIICTLASIWLGEYRYALTAILFGLVTMVCVFSGAILVGYNK